MRATTSLSSHAINGRYLRGATSNALCSFVGTDGRLDCVLQCRLKQICRRGDSLATRTFERQRSPVARHERRVVGIEPVLIVLAINRQSDRWGHLGDILGMSSLLFGAPVRTLF